MRVDAQLRLGARGFAGGVAVAAEQAAAGLGRAAQVRVEAEGEAGMRRRARHLARRLRRVLRELLVVCGAVAVGRAFPRRTQCFIVHLERWLPRRALADREQPRADRPENSWFPD